MHCKICEKNETDSTSGLCWECANRIYFIPIIEPPFDMGEGYSNYNGITPENEKTTGETPRNDLTQTNKLK